MKTNHIFLVLDKSGSMQDCKDDTIGGFNSFLANQQKSGNKIKFTMALFDSDGIEKRWDNEDIKKVEPLNEDTYIPGAMTPLWDAIGRTINGADNKVKKALFVILTDGHENYSREYTSQTVKSMIKKKEKSGWKFLFLGANLDNFDDAHSIGINLKVGVYKDNMADVYTTLSNTVDGYCKTGAVSYDEKNVPTSK